MTTSLYAPVASPGDVSAKNYTSLYSDSLTPGPNPSGDVTIQGNLTVRGGNIYTTATTASIFPTNATTVHAFNAATNLLIGPSTGYTTIGNNLNVNGEYIILNADFQGNPPINPSGTGWAGIIANRGVGNPGAYINWIETGVFNTSYWEVDNDMIIFGDLTTTQGLFVQGDQIVGNSAQTGSPVTDFYLTARRGSSPDTNIRWNEATDTWQFSNDGTTYYDMVTGGSGGSATFGKITIAVANDHAISTTSGPLTLAAANGVIQANTSDFTADNLYAVTSIISYGALGANDKTLTLNNDDGTDTNDGFITIKRGGTGSAVSLKWNESIDKWQFTNDGSTYFNMVGSDPSTGDVAVTGNITATGTIIADAQIGTNGNQILLNADDVTLTGNAGLTVRRGASADVSLRWNYTTNHWQFTNDGTTYYDMVSSIDTLTDVVITSPTAGQLLTYDGTNWINNYTIVANSANQTINLERSGAFNGDTPTSTRSAARLTKKFTDVTGAPTDRGGPGLLFNVQDSASTNYAFATVTSNYSSTGDHDVRILTSTDNFATANEAVSFTATETTFPQNITVGGTVNASSINLDTRVIKNTSTATYTSATQQVFGNVPIATYRTIKYIWQISRGTEFQAVETLVTHDGTFAHMVAYGDVRTGSNLADFNVDISGGNMRILVTPTSAASTTLTCDYSLFYI